MYVSNSSLPKVGKCVDSHDLINCSSTVFGVEGVRGGGGLLSLLVISSSSSSSISITTNS